MGETYVVKVYGNPEVSCKNNIAVRSFNFVSIWFQFTSDELIMNCYRTVVFKQLLLDLYVEETAACKHLLIPFYTQTLPVHMQLKVMFVF